MFINNEISNCLVGVLVYGEGSVVRGNYIHDLELKLDDVIYSAVKYEPTGMYLNGPDVEVSWNAFVNVDAGVDSPPVAGECGGNTFQMTPIDSSLSRSDIYNVNVHHNYVWQNCGFFHVSTALADTPSVVSDVRFHHNVVIDSAWMGFVEVGYTSIDDLRFYNNTMVQHQATAEAGYVWMVKPALFDGIGPMTLSPGSVSLTNELYILDNVGFKNNPPINVDIVQNNVLLSQPGTVGYQDTGVANLGGVAPWDFDLVRPGGAAVDGGTDIPSGDLDFFNRTRKVGTAVDIGAFEYGAGQEQCIPTGNFLLLVI
jgi:hypothetical protein